MTQPPRLPFPVRLLLRVGPVPRDRRTEVEADLRELFAGRRSDRGALHAYWRLYHDLASLWLGGRRLVPATAHGPLHGAQTGRAGLLQATLALARDARGDLKYAVRLFARQPAILLLTIVGLSLGLGIATAAFSIMNAAALRGEGLHEPGRAPGILRTTDRSMSTTWKYEEFLRLREGSTRMQVEAVLTDAAPVRTTGSMARADAEEARSAGVAFVSGGFFGATGGRVVAGRPIEASDEKHAGPPPVVVSFAFWTRTLDSDSHAVGRTIRVGRAAATIVGVAERGFSVPGSCRLWMPITTYGAVYDGSPVNSTPEMGIRVIGRLLPGVSLSEAEAQLTGVAAGLSAGAVGSDPAPRVKLDSRAGLGRVSSSDMLGIVVPVLAVIGLVLLLACANVATVLIATAITRAREMGLRAALGASRGRIIRQLVTESLAVGAVAAAIGLMFAVWAIPMIGTMIEAPADADLAPDLNVYLFLGVVTLLSGVAAGLAPAWHGRGADLLTPLKGEARQGRVAPGRMRSMLVMTQAAVSVLLIVMATLFVRASFRAATIDVGFDAAGLYAVSPGLGTPFNSDGVDVRNFWARAIPELQTIPGIAAVTLTELTPFGGLTKTSTPNDAPGRVIWFHRTGFEYFETLGLRTLAGRTFTPSEVRSGAPVALVSYSLARAYWPDRSPLGQLLPAEIPVPQLAPSAVPARPVVIGVVADAITGPLHERSPYAVYEPLHPDREKFAQLLVRVKPGTTGVIDQAGKRLRSIDPQADVRIASVAALLQQEAGRPRMLAALSAMVGVIAIILCVIGLYGLTAAVVGQRSHEMAVRAAIGAEPRDLLRLLMWNSLKPVVFGLALGAGAALIASRVVLSAVLFGVSPGDPMAFTGAAVILLAAATLAVLVPTRRAAGVDAARILRQS